ncbi:hypothetical protein VP01_1217g2 [Puccinia sorghi]|uniref:Uncharacterized protein n=1 Tax=Puccinia sorghi TaxID=27349 RepID=A0A0L6VRM6_9BASI|nr:hypothetical protein VP01_1217g2 [Puccinia sorghi]
MGLKNLILLRDADSSLDVFQMLKKYFHNSMRACQLELINSLIKMDTSFLPGHFKQFFSIMFQLSGLRVDTSVNCTRSIFAGLDGSSNGNIKDSTQKFNPGSGLEV